MTSTIVSRLGQYVIVLLVAVSLNFMLPRLMPGNPLALIAGADVGQLTPEQRQEVVERAGLDKPLPLQFVGYLGDLVTGDLGYSYRQKRPIADIIIERLPWTLLLAGTSLVISAILGTILGAISAWRRGRTTDVAALVGMIALESLPSFWLGMLLVSVFSVQLGIFPSFGARTPAGGLEGWDAAMDVAGHAFLPVLTLSVLSVPGIYLTMRYSMLGIMGEDFIRTARAKGLGERAILFRHAARNALIPVVTVIALRLGFAFGGTVVVETVFSYPGLGRLIFEAVSGRDYPVMQATFLVFTIAVLISNLLADYLYPLLDPRAREA
ncbi:MAG TPA: ABC transporter permease [Candidatus Limnocylindrales bacterium]|jgi:peptide/nickel transport system permease protein|nr:ABC transporter permease [Candidatus Limnocylindrales bacterium]